MNRDKGKYIIIGACLFTYALYLLSVYLQTGGEMGVPLDDVYIHFRYAENIATGHFFEFNIGEPTSGTTSPLYALTLAAFSLVSPNFFFNAIFLSALFHLLTCLLVYRFTIYLFSEDSNAKELLNGSGLNARACAFIAAMLTLLAGRFAWSAISGMETTMFAFLTLLSIYTYTTCESKTKRILLTTLLIAISSAVRPEGMLLYSIFGLIAFANSVKDKSVMADLPKYFLSLLIFAAIAFPYFIFSYYVSGSFFPNTFKGQGGQFHSFPGLNYLRVALVFFSRDNMIVAVLFAAGFVYLLWNIKDVASGRFGKMTFMLLWLYLLPIASSLVLQNWRHHMRYMIPLIPVVSICSIYFLLIFLQSERLKNLRRKLSISPRLYALLPAFSILYYCLFTYYIGKNTQNINDMQVETANWVKQNISRDEILAANDIGALAFISKNRIVDMAGLVTPEILRYRQYSWDDNLDSMKLLLVRNNVNYVIIFDHWFREFLDRYDKNLIFIRSARLDFNTICGGQELKVYRTKFTEKH